jgi:hypothetical protein
VESDADGCTANKASDDARDASITVRIVGNNSFVTDRGDTGGRIRNNVSVREYLQRSRRF